MGKIQNTPGSLLRKIGNAVGVDQLTLTKIRRAAEIVIQQNEAMKRKGKILNNHSQKVGQNIYDITNSRVRVEYIGYLNNMEKQNKKFLKLKKNKEREQRKKLMELEDAKLREKHAREFLEKEQLRRKQNVGFTKRCNVRPADKVILQNLFFKKVFGNKIQKFPNESKWKKLFYRFLDTCEDVNDLQTLRKTKSKYSFHFSFHSLKGSFF